MKYFVQSGKITGVERIKDHVEIGWTLDPVTRLPPGVPGSAGPANTWFIVKDTEIHQINDGTPDALAVAAFNTLMAPLKWNNIGSKIRFSIGAGITGDVKNQVYPTYNIYVSKNIVEQRPQAPEPKMNFNTAPYPPGPPFPPYYEPKP